MSTEIKLLVAGEEIIVEASSEHLSAVKAAGTRFMNQHEATSATFTFDGTAWSRAVGGRWVEAAQVHAETTSENSATDINVVRNEPAPASDLKAVPEMDARFDELPEADADSVREAVVYRKGTYEARYFDDATRAICSEKVSGALLSEVVTCAVMAAKEIKDCVNVFDSKSRAVALVSKADGVLVHKSLVKPEAKSVKVDSKWSCVATFRKVMMSAIVLLGTAFYAVASPAPAQACETWDVAPATHQRVLAEGFREHFSYTLPNGEYVEVVGDLLPDRAQCDRALDEDLVKLEAELENARAEAGTVILEKVIGSCHYEQVVDGLHRPAWRK